MSKLLFQTIQFSINKQFSSTGPIDRTLSDASITGPTEHENNDNKEQLRVPQSSSISGASSSDCLVSYPGHSFERSWDAVGVFGSSSRLGQMK